MVEDDNFEGEDRNFYHAVEEFPKNVANKRSFYFGYRLQKNAALNQVPAGTERAPASPIYATAYQVWF